MGCHKHGYNQEAVTTQAGNSSIWKWSGPVTLAAATAGYSVLAIHLKKKEDKKQVPAKHI